MVQKKILNLNIIIKKIKKNKEGGSMQYFKDGKNINRNNTQNNKQVNNTKKQNNLKNNRIKIDISNPAPMDNTRWQPSTHVDYEKYRDQQELQGLFNYYENNADNLFAPFDWHSHRKRKWYEGLFDWVDNFKNGSKINIKESQKGSFTKYCGGNVTSECIARGKASPDPRIRKKATFAANARKWKHREGGELTYKSSFEDLKNAKVDPEALDPYGLFTYGLEYNDLINNEKFNSNIK